MNDFHKRNRISGNDKRYDSTRRPPSYNPQYRGNDKQAKDRRKGPNRKISEMEQQTNILAEIVTDMKGLLESIEQSNKRLTEMEERRVGIEERQTAALEKIAEYLAGGTIQQPRPVGESEGKDDSDIPQGKPDNDTKQKIIQMILERREAGMSYNQIALKLTEEGIPTFSGKGKWHSQTVQKIGKAGLGEI